MDRLPTVLEFIGGASIELDLPDHEVGPIRTAFDFAVKAEATREPTVRYFRVDEGPYVTRHDTFRDLTIETLDGGLHGVIDDLHLTIALHATDELFIHAGVVVFDGVVIIIPGRSHAGKSTLVDELVRSGAVYFSDEYARVTPDGSIRAYPRPIQLRTPDGRRIVEPTRADTSLDTALPPGLVVSTRYEPNSVFEPHPMSPARAALELFDNVVVARLDPERAMAAVASIARVAHAVHSLRPDVRDTAPRILELAATLSAAGLRGQPQERT